MRHWVIKNLGRYTHSIHVTYLLVLVLLLCTTHVTADLSPNKYQDWRLPNIAPHPAGVPFSANKAELGKMLFFDQRLSGAGNMSCASCHDPEKGWSDGRETAIGHKGKKLTRATLTVINVGFNKILMWDGRAKTLEEQALSPIFNPNEMHNTNQKLIARLKRIPGYIAAFSSAYMGLGINNRNIRNALAAFQRTIVANNSPFDRWLAGDNKALSKQQIEGFNIFVDSDKGNCAKCHRPPNFTDNGFHNIGLKSFGKRNADPGRHNIIPVRTTNGAFKTPSLRNISQTAPYFHDGSAKTLNQVITHYTSGGVVKNISPNMLVLKINTTERKALIAFLHSLTSELDPLLTTYSLPK